MMLHFHIRREDRDDLLALGHVTPSGWQRLDSGGRIQIQNCRKWGGSRAGAHWAHPIGRDVLRPGVGCMDAQGLCLACGWGGGKAEGGRVPATDMGPDAPTPGG